MRKKITDADTKLIRVKVRTAKLLDGFSKNSYDEAIRFLWTKVSDQGKKIKKLRRLRRIALKGDVSGSDAQTSQAGGSSNIAATEQGQK